MRDLPLRELRSLATVTCEPPQSHLPLSSSLMVLHDGCYPLPQPSPRLQPSSPLAPFLPIVYRCGLRDVRRGKYPWHNPSTVSHIATLPWAQREGAWLAPRLPASVDSGLSASRHSLYMFCSAGPQCDSSSP